MAMKDKDCVQLGREAFERVGERERKGLQQVVEMYGMKGAAREFCQQFSFRGIATFNYIFLSEFMYCTLVKSYS